VYLISKQLEYLFINETNYRNLYWSVALKEEYYLKILSIKSKIQIINMVFILHKMFIAGLVLYNISGVFFFVHFMIMIGSVLMNIYKNYTSYSQVRDFYKKIEEL
jgi:hypothetical protein